jgi:coatomer subunit beta
MSPIENEKHCTVIIFHEKGAPPTSDEFAQRLESKKDHVKAEALEELILLMINGEQFPKLLMTVIRFVVTCNDHRVKRMLMLYWEVVDKCRVDGELKEEMILVCNALRNDLMHSNEYVRGCTLRLLCKMKYYKILEPLKEAISRNLSHKNSYVRRNAAMCVYSIVKTFGLDVMPEAAEEMEQLLLVEGDITTKRNAFLMLTHCEPQRAIKYALSIQEQLPSSGDIFQLAVLELVRKVCRSDPALKNRFIRIVFTLASLQATSVAYECASSLVSLTSSPVAVHQALVAYMSLLTEQSDNNVKLIVLGRMQEVQKHHKQVMESMVIDVMRALSSPSLDVRKKVLDICLGSLVSPRNVKDVVGVLKKEVIKTMGAESSQTEGNQEYRRLLIRALHSCTAQYSEHAQSVTLLLMDFLVDSDQTAATEVVMFVREIIANYPEARVQMLEDLCGRICEVPQSRVLRGILWLFGEYCPDESLAMKVISELLTALKPFPLIAGEKDSKDKKEGGKEKKDNASARVISTKTVVLADGTYGTENVYEKVEEQSTSKETRKSCPLRSILLDGDLLLSAMVAVTLTKLSLSIKTLSAELRNEVLFVLANIFKLVRDGSNGGECSDGAIRITQCIRALVSGANCLSQAEAMATKMVQDEWQSGAGHSQLSKVLEVASVNSEWASGSGEEEVQERTVAPDEGFVFRQLLDRKGAGLGGDSLGIDDDFDAARGKSLSGDTEGALFTERLAKVQQMTGLADDVYVEAFLQVHSFDLVLELFLVNRTQDTLENVAVELSTQGELKIVDRPSEITLAPGQQTMVHASVKVGSTEAGTIFGYITYEVQSSEDKGKKKKDDEDDKMKECITMNQIHVDILDYIERAWAGELNFRTMWSEFEWENKININTTITEVSSFLGHFMRNTNMSIVGQSCKKHDGKKAKKQARLSAEDVQEMLEEAVGLQNLINSSSYVAVNLYAKSIFGEDALANVSIEKKSEGKLAGSIRIRSRTQGIALSLGDRVTVTQRGLDKSAKHA